jgi:hypothetical protein
MRTNSISRNSLVQTKIKEGVRHDIRAAWFCTASSAGLICSLCREQRRQSCRVRPAGQHRNSLSTNQDRRGRHDIRAAWFRTASSAGLLCSLCREQRRQSCRVRPAGQQSSAAVLPGRQTPEIGIIYTIGIIFIL